MHRLLARVLRERDHAAGRWRETVEAALDLIEPLLFEKDEAWSRRTKGTELAIQVEALWDASDTAGSADLELAGRLLGARYWAVRRLLAAADLTRAIDTGIRVLTDCVRVLGEDHLQTLSARGNLAVAYRSAGRLGEAIPLYEQNLPYSVQVLGENHPHILTWRGNLAGAYRSAGRLGEAIPLYEQNLADSVRVLGEDHPTSWSGGATSRAPTGRRGDWARRSRYTSRTSPTRCGCSARTTPTSWSGGTTSRAPTGRRGGWMRRSRYTSRASITRCRCSARTTRKPWLRGTTSQAPTSRRGGWTRRSGHRTKR